MDYDDALRKDKRVYCKCFIDNLINDQIIILLLLYISYDSLKPRINYNYFNTKLDKFVSNKYTFANLLKWSTKHNK